MDKKRKSFLLTIITTVFTFLWLTFFVLSLFRKVFNSQGVGMNFLFVLLTFFSLIFPFVGLYLWFSDNFRLKSKYLIVLIFSLTPWIIILLVSVRDIILESLFGCDFNCLFHTFI